MLSQQSFNTTEVSLQHLKTSIIREVLATFTPEAIAKAISSATTGESDYRPIDDGSRKRLHPDDDEDDNEMDYGSVSISGDRYGPLDDSEPTMDIDRPVGGSSNGNLPKDVSFVASKSQTDNLSDLFPQKKKQKGSDPSNEQQLNVADEILHQIDEDMPCTDTLGEPIIDGLATRIIKQFKLDQTKITKEFLERQKLPKNCSELAVPMMNEMVRDMKGFDSIRHVERRLYNIQTNILRATAALSKIANSILASDEKGQMAESKMLVRTALDGVTLLGQAQTSLNIARKNKVKEILTDEVKEICNPSRKPTTYLFGDNINKSIKKAKEMFRMGKSLGTKVQQKQKFPQQGTSTFVRPANNQFAQRNTAQTPFLGRGRKPARGKRPQYSQFNQK